MLSKDVALLCSFTDYSSVWHASDHGGSWFYNGLTHYLGSNALSYEPSSTKQRCFINKVEYLVAINVYHFHVLLILETSVFPTQNDKK